MLPNANFFKLSLPFSYSAIKVLGSWPVKSRTAAEEIISDNLRLSPFRLSPSPRVTRNSLS